jgi:NAD(P)-dependent dehydrogenase (short-subunit alcohol dehydrogenase family)
MKKLLIIGASSAIAHATITSLMQSYKDIELHCVSRSNTTLDDTRVTWHQSDHTKLSIAQIAESLIEQRHLFDAVLIFNGQLQTKQNTPEKRISEFDDLYLNSLVASNVLPHLLWYAYLSRLLLKHSSTKIIVLSARIGSITDNRSGGWYSYRMTKAMLNMATKCFAIELARTHPNSKVILFHPGTNDTPLSQPFQKNVPSDKLLDLLFTAQRIINMLSTVHDNNHAEFIDWQGKTIEW